MFKVGEKSASVETDTDGKTSSEVADALSAIVVSLHCKETAILCCNENVRGYP
jgi:hypothetical protein